MRRMALVVLTAVLMLFALDPLPAQELSSPAVKAARSFLDALKVSDLKRAEAGATLSMVEWARRYMPVLYDYRVLREEPRCEEEFQLAADLSTRISVYLNAASHFDDMLKGFLDRRVSPPTDEMKKLSDEMNSTRNVIAETNRCLATVLNRTQVQGLIPQSLADGKASLAMIEVLVDVDTPGTRGDRKTERRELSVARFSTRQFDSGWKAVGFGVFNPKAR
jgi:hypothetical protein